MLLGGRILFKKKTPGWKSSLPLSSAKKKKKKLRGRVENKLNFIFYDFSLKLSPSHLIYYLFPRYAYT